MASPGCEPPAGRREPLGARASRPHNPINARSFEELCGQDARAPSGDEFNRKNRFLPTVCAAPSHRGRALDRQKSNPKRDRDAKRHVRRCERTTAQIMNGLLLDEFVDIFKIVLEFVRPCAEEQQQRKNRKTHNKAFRRWDEFPVDANTETFNIKFLELPMLVLQ